MSPRTVTLTLEELSDLINRAVDEQVSRRARQRDRDKQVNRYWTYRWTAWALGVGEDEVRAMVKRGELATKRVNAHGPFVTRASIETWLHARGLRAQWDRFPDQPVGVPL